MDLDTNRIAMDKIDKFREGLRDRKVKINVKNLVEKNKKELQDRTDKILGNLK